MAGWLSSNNYLSGQVVADNPSALHDQADPAQRGYVAGWVGFGDDQVGDIPGFHGADVVFSANEPCRVDGAGAKGLLRRRARRR